MCIGVYTYSKIRQNVNYHILTANIPQCDCKIMNCILFCRQREDVLMSDRILLIYHNQSFVSSVGHLQEYCDCTLHTNALAFSTMSSVFHHIPSVLHPAVELSCQGSAR